MATGDYGQFDRKSAERIGAVVRRVEGTQRNNIPRGPVGPPRDTPPRLAKVTTSAIAAESTGEVTLQKSDWTATTRVIDDCVNDSSFELAVGTKLYIMRIAGSWRIIWAGGECPA